jgi:hypothetical protein
VTLVAIISASPRFSSGCAREARYQGAFTAGTLKNADTDAEVILFSQSRHQIDLEICDALTARWSWYSSRTGERGP